jgi:hypothetical protein
MKGGGNEAPSTQISFVVLHPVKTALNDIRIIKMGLFSPRVGVTYDLRGSDCASLRFILPNFAVAKPGATPATSPRSLFQRDFFYFNF